MARGPYAIDAVIVAYASRASVGGCVDAARAVKGVGEIVVVDHGADGSADIAVAHGARVVRDTANPGFGAGVNRGLRLGAAPFVLLVNPDARVVPAGVAAGITLLEARPEVAAVQGVIESARGALPDRSHGRALASVHLWGRALRLRRLLDLGPVRRIARRVPALVDHAERVPARPVDVEALAATAWLARRAALEAVGGFDERYFLYGEDMDLCRRLRAAGWRLVALPDRWAVHGEGGSSASSWEREVQWWRGTMTYAARWWAAPAWTSAVLAAVVCWLRLAVTRPSGARRAFTALVVVPSYERRER